MLRRRRGQDERPRGPRRTFAAALLLALAAGAWSPAPVRARPEAPDPAPETSAAAPASEGADTAVREIPVTLVTDARYRRRAGWRDMARGAVELASGGLAGAAGFRLVPGEEIAWDPPSPDLSLAAVLDAAVDATGSREGLTVVILDRRPRDGADRAERGYAYLGRPAMVVVAPTAGEAMFAGGPRKALALFIRHELGHVFGIPHLRGRNVMAASESARSWDFTGVSLDVLRAQRNVEFGAAAPFTGADLDVLRDAFLLWDERGEGEPSLLVNLGVALYHRRRPAEARRLFAAALRRDPLSTVGRLGYGQAALAAGDSAAAREAADFLNGAGELTPAQQSALGGIWVGLGEEARADSVLTAAVAADTTAFAPWFNRGLARFRLERYSGARDDFRRALGVEERPEGWFNLGLACDALADTAGAVAAFLRVRELAPEEPMGGQAARFLNRLQPEGGAAPR